MSSLYIAFELSQKDKDKLIPFQTYLKQNAIGDFVDSTTFHITCRFLSENQENVNLAIEGMKLFDKKYLVDKIELEAKDFCKFEQGVMWIGVNNSFPLYEVKKKIEECLIEVGYPLKKDTHKGYTPHITMGYNIKEESTLNRQFIGVDLTIDNLSLWAGFKCNDQYIHNKIYDIKFK